MCTLCLKEIRTFNYESVDFASEHFLEMIEKCSSTSWEDALDWLLASAFLVRRFILIYVRGINNGRYPLAFMLFLVDVCRSAWLRRIRRALMQIDTNELIVPRLFSSLLLAPKSSILQNLIIYSAARDSSSTTFWLILGICNFFPPPLPSPLPSPLFISLSITFLRDELETRQIHHDRSDVMNAFALYRKRANNFMMITKKQRAEKERTNSILIAWCLKIF